VGFKYNHYISRNPVPGFESGTGGFRIVSFASCLKNDCVSYNTPCLGRIISTLRINRIKLNILTPIGKDISWPILCLWFRASLIHIINWRMRCNTKQSIYYSASSLYMFRVSTTPITGSEQNCNYSLRYCAATSFQRGQPWPIWREVATHKIWPVPEAVVTVLCSLDDGCFWHLKHVEWTCRIINRLLWVAPRWTIINPLTPNDPYRGRTAPLTSKRCNLFIYSIYIYIYILNILNMVYTVLFSLQNAVCFIILTFSIPVLFTFYIQAVLKLKKKIIPTPKD